MLQDGWMKDSNPSCNMFRWTYGKAEYLQCTNHEMTSGAKQNLQAKFPFDFAQQTQSSTSSMGGTSC
jgi:hypothetical protein